MRGLFVLGLVGGVVTLVGVVGVLALGAAAWFSARVDLAEMAGDVAPGEP